MEVAYNILLRSGSHLTDNRCVKFNPGRITPISPPSLRSLLTGMIFTFLSLTALANDLEIKPGDAYLEIAENKEGFYLYIRASNRIGSVMLTESSSDPLKKSASYAFRTWDYNPINGDEKRVLNGKFLVSKKPLYFLLDSTPEPNKLLETAFRIYVPFQLTYGYPWSREGQITVHRGTWLNIRAFEKPYADYSGSWKDNPFVLSMKEIPLPPEPEIPVFEDESVDNIEAAVERMTSIMASSKGSIDVVLVVDTTISMKDDINFIREALIPLVRKRIENFKSFRIGLVLYRDYKEAYLTRSSPFTNDLNTLQKTLNRVTTSGGRDLPEAVTEGLFAALTEFDWEAPERAIIQVGDAPAHDEPRGEITPKMVEDTARNLGVTIFPIRLPDKK